MQLTPSRLCSSQRNPHMDKQAPPNAYQGRLHQQEEARGACNLRRISALQVDAFAMLALWTKECSRRDASSVTSCRSHPAQCADLTPLV
mmetsp:Transcript_51109/g.119688  ORF Transcript_51109/g.119688 Transcript_51109/m.119688 type:complete len:89 (-) Transcript_51109:27-293(-)